MSRPKDVGRVSARFCPMCGARTSVEETRDTHETVRRRRLCSRRSCAFKFTTVEILRTGKRPPVAVDVMTASRLCDRVRELLADLDMVLNGPEAVEALKEPAP